MANPFWWITSVFTVRLEIPPSAAFHSGRYAAALWIAYFGYSRSRPGRPSCWPASCRELRPECPRVCPRETPRWPSEPSPSADGARNRRLLLVTLQSVPGGWKPHGQPGNGRGQVRSAGGVGGKPLAATSAGLSHGKLLYDQHCIHVRSQLPKLVVDSQSASGGRDLTHLQGKFDGSFMSIHSASMSTPPSGSKNSANSLSQYAVMFSANQSGNEVTPGQTTPCQIEPLARRSQMSSSTPRLKGP